MKFEVVEGTIELQGIVPFAMQLMIIECGALTMLGVEMRISIEVKVVIEHYPRCLMCQESWLVTAGMGTTTMLQN